MEYLSKSSKETKNIAGKLAQSLKGGEVIALYGDLGSGKTTFVQGLVSALGGREREVISPTFVLRKEYKASNGKVIHIDLYRLNTFDDLGLRDDFENKSSIVVIEWAEKIKDLLPKDTLKIEFKYISKHKRSIQQNSKDNR